MAARTLLGASMKDTLLELGDHAAPVVSALKVRNTR
jgi:hypothetical protein